jgi:hypothetical protein
MIPQEHPIRPTPGSSPAGRPPPKPDVLLRWSLPAVSAAIWLALAVILAVAGADLYFKEPLLQRGDAAVNALQIDNARHFTELYGNYSRFQFNHPGPAFFYVYAAGEGLFFRLLRLVPGPDNAHLLTSMLLQAFFFALALGIIFTHLRWRALPPLTLAAAALYFGALKEPFVSIWPPHVLLMPSLCFLAACVSVACGRIRRLPIAVLAGGFLFHGHVAQPLFVGPLGGAALVLYFRGLRPRKTDAREGWIARKDRSIWFFCCGLVCLFLLPLAIDVLTLGRQSNVATIIGRFRANTSDAKTMFQSALYFVSFATGSRDQAAIFTRMGAQTVAFLAGNFWSIGLWGSIFVLPPAAAFLARARLAPEERRFFGVAYGFLAAAAGLCLLWGKAQAGTMEHFNGFFYYGLYYFALVLALGLVARSLERFCPPPAAAAACAVAVLVFAWSFYRPPHPDDAGQAIGRGVEAALCADPVRGPKLLVFEHYTWPVVAAVALDLQRRGIMFYMTPAWDFVFGARHEIPGPEATPVDRLAVWWITTPGDGGAPISPDLSIYTQPAPIRPAGDEIRFERGDNGFRYVVSGLSPGNVDHALSDLPRVVLLFRPLPAGGDVRVVFDACGNLYSKDAPREQPADVYFNGKRVGSVSEDVRAEVAVTVPAALWNSAQVGRLELRFPKAGASSTFERPAYQEWSAWGLWKIRFETPGLGGNAENARPDTAVRYRGPAGHPAASAAVLGLPNAPVSFVWPLSIDRTSFAVHAWMLANAIAWLALAGMLWQLIPGNGLRDWLARGGVLLSAGALSSIQSSMTDLIGVALLSGAMLAVERRRQAWAGGLLGVTAIARGASLLAIPALVDPPWLSWPNLRRILPVLAAAAGAFLWAVWRFDLKTPEFIHLGLPMVAYAGRWKEGAGSILHGGNPLIAWTGLVSIAGVTVQAVYLLLNRRTDERWWRLGAAYAVLLLFLDGAMWAGTGGGAARLLLPLVLAFNVFARRSRASPAWLLAGNLVVVAGILGLFRHPVPPADMAAVRAAGYAEITTKGDDWFELERLPLHTWSWSRGCARLEIETWPHSSRPLTVRFGLQSLTPRTVIIRQDGKELLRVRLDRRLVPVQFVCRVADGFARLEMATDMPAVPENSAPDARALAFAVYDPLLAVQEP